MTRCSKLRIAFTLFAILALAAAVPLAAQGPGHGPGPGPGNASGPCLGAGAGPGFGAGPGPGFGPGAHRGLGGHRGGPGFHLGRLALYLELTDEQIEAARAIFEAAREETEPIREAQKVLHDELTALLDSESPDATAVGELVLAIDANRDAAQDVREAAFEDFKALLTAEQLAKLERLLEVRRHFGAPGDPEDGGADA